MSFVPRSHHAPLKKWPSCHFLTELLALEIHVTKLASSWSNNLNSRSVICSFTVLRKPSGHVYDDQSFDAVPNAVDYVYWRCRRTSRKPRSRRSELEKGDSRDFLFETPSRAQYLPSIMHYLYKKANLWDDSFWQAGAPCATKASLGEVIHVCQTRVHGHFGLVFFFFF